MPTYNENDEGVQWILTVFNEIKIITIESTLGKEYINHIRVGDNWDPDVPKLPVAFEFKSNKNSRMILGLAEELNFGVIESSIYFNTVIFPRDENVYSNYLLPLYRAYVELQEDNKITQW